MGIVGPRPETGVRIDLMRPPRGGPPWHYEGKIATATEQFQLTAVVSEAGDVAISAGARPEGAVQKARLMLRTAWKHARDDAAPPPRRIVRWRA